MHGPINVKSPNNTSKWQMGFNSAFKGLTNITGITSKSKNTVKYPYFSICNEANPTEGRVASTKASGKSNFKR
jgi:hypothetical protein